MKMNNQQTGGTRVVANVLFLTPKGADVGTAGRGQTVMVSLATYW